MGVKGKILRRAVGIGMAGFAGVTTFNENRERGNDIVTSAAKAGASVAIQESIGIVPAIGLGLAKGIGQGMVTGGFALDSMARDMQRRSVPIAFQNANFMDTQANYTMRQAGMKLAEASKFNVQQTLMGNEARYLNQ